METGNLFATFIQDIAWGGEKRQRRKDIAVIVPIEDLVLLKKLE